MNDKTTRKRVVSNSCHMNQHDRCTLKDCDCDCHSDLRTALTHATAEVERLTKERDRTNYPTLPPWLEGDVHQWPIAAQANYHSWLSIERQQDLSSLRAANAELLKERDAIQVTLGKLVHKWESKEPGTPGRILTALADYVSEVTNTRVSSRPPQIELEEFIAHLKTVAFQAQEATKELLGKLTAAVAWHPIGTAPKNHKLIAGYFNSAGKWRTVTACYHTRLAIAEDDYDYSDDAPDNQYAPEGWYEESDSQETLVFTQCDPTHWMPLPKAPAARATPQAGKGEA